jgi:hypothetical protein
MGFDKFRTRGSAGSARERRRLVRGFAGPLKARAFSKRSRALPAFL